MERLLDVTKENNRKVKDIVELVERRPDIAKKLRVQRDTNNPTSDVNKAERKYLKPVSRRRLLCESCEGDESPLPAFDSVNRE
jgi:hypothetical protein